MFVIYILIYLVISTLLCFALTDGGDADFWGFAYASLFFIPGLIQFIVDVSATKD
jgi:hypothetical protein